MTAATLELELGSVEETELLGAQLAEVVERGDVIFLSGELGAGKTSLSRGFLRRFFADPELEVHTLAKDRVGLCASPRPTSPGKRTLVHLFAGFRPTKQGNLSRGG